MTKKTIALPEQITTSDDYKNLVDLLAVYSEATDQKLILQARLNQDQRELVDEHRQDIVATENAIAQSEAAIRVICDRHPEWFEKSKTLKTPYGSCAYRKTSEIVAESEDTSIALIKAAGRGADFIRVVEELDREALEKLSELELKAFGLERKTENKFSTKAGKVDLGKAAAQNAEEAQAA